VGQTLQDDQGGNAGPAGTAQAQLFVVIEGMRPLVESTRHPLGAAAVVEIGRGAARGAASLTRSDGEHIAITIPDPFMSETHASLVQRDGWILRCAGARNRTLVNGQPVTEHRLRDGDCVEMGRTFFLFRASLEDAHDDPVPGLATMIPPLRARFVELARVARSGIPVMLLGETGTGKEVTAQAVHRLSARAGAFVPVNCGALPEQLLLSELFGHLRGSFSGAVDDRVGLVRAADGGTLFLDEIGDLPASSQTAFLRVLQEREVVPIGASRAVPVDLRLVTATLHDLDAQVADGRFRSDLFARIGGYTMRMPALRERKEDLGLLIADHVRRARGDRASKVTFTSPALRAIFRHAWPMNIRELGRALETALVLAGDGAIDEGHLAVRLADNPGESEPDRILRVLDECGGNQSEAARVLGIPRRTFLRRLDELGVARPRKRS
jgi:DNA-binding NtrC family response regulator